MKDLKDFLVNETINNENILESKEQITDNEIKEFEKWFKKYNVHNEYKLETSNNEFIITFDETSNNGQFTTNSSMRIKKETDTWKISRPTNNSRMTYPSNKSNVKLKTVKDVCETIEMFSGWLDYLSK